MEIYDVIIIGAGPAGLTASIYASRYKLKNLVLGKILGGELSLASKIENIPGSVSVPGVEWATKVKDQVVKLGADFSLKEVDKILKEQGKFVVVSDQEQERFEAKTLIVATGSERRRLNIPGEKEYQGKGVSYCTTCLPPGEEVVANSSLKKIGKIGIAQKVLTRDGSFQNINQIMARNYEGEIVKIKTRFFTEPVTLTSNHPVLYVRINREYHEKRVATTSPQWKKAGRLTKTDALLYPVIKKTKDVKQIRFSEILGVEIKNGKARNNQETYSSHRLNNKIPIDRNFLRLAGYYLAEGCVTRHGVNFYFNKKEKDFIKDVEKLVEEVFSLKPFVKTEGSVTRICLFSKLVRDLFHSLFGKYAPGKKLPQWVLFLPLKKQKEIIKGFYRGDGCLRDKDFCLVTTSRTLAYQLKDLLLRFGIIPSVVKRKKEKLNKFPGEIGRRKIRFNCDKYHLSIGGPSLEKMSKLLGVYHPKIDKRKWVCRHAWIENDSLYLPIREISRGYYQGKVYNLAVDKNNTYVARNFIVHNCDAPFFRDKTVALIGGSDAAVSGAVHTAEYAKKVYIIYRRDKLRAEPIWIDQWQQIEKTGKGETIYNTNITEILGDNSKVMGVKLDNSYQNKDILPVDGVFIEIGGVPGTGLVKPLGVTLNESGHVVVDEEMRTNVEALFCAGDMVDKSKVMQQAITAMAQGAIAAGSTYKYLKGEKAPQIVGI